MLNYISLKTQQKQLEMTPIRVLENQLLRSQSVCRHPKVKMLCLYYNHLYLLRERIAIHFQAVPC